MLGHRTALRRAAAPGAAPAPVPPPGPRGPGPSAADLLTPAAVADLLGVKPKVLERWRGTGEGPRFVRLTRKTIRYCLADIEAFIAARGAKIGDMLRALTALGQARDTGNGRFVA